MSVGLEATLDLSSPTNWILVLSHISSDRSLNLLYEQFPSIRADRIRLSTRYYNADIPLRTKSMAQLSRLLNNPEFIRSLQTVPAVVVVSNVRDDISECQRTWNNIKNSVREDALRALLLFENLPDAEDQELMEWAVANEIEIVSPDNGHGDSESQKLLELLACAPWQIQSRLKTPISSNTVGSESSHADAEIVKRQLETDRDLKVQEGKSAVEDVSSDQNLLNLSQGTRLRRGLLEKDISSILSDLLLAESDSDDTE